VATSYCNIGKLYIHLKKYNEALENLQQAYAIYKREKLSYSIPNALSGIGDYYSETDRPEMAIHYYDTALTYVEQNGQKKMKMDIYSSLSESYESLGQYQKAHTYHKLYAAIKDSLFDENKSKELSRNEAKYEFEKLKQADKMADEKKDAIAEQEIMRQRVILYSLGLGFLALLVFAVFILRSYNQKKKINSQLEEVNALIQEKNKSITDSINYAKRIQKAILPSPKAVRHLLPDSFVFLKPKDIVSGDFYWIDKTPGGKVLFTAVDCTGHGVPGAMVSVVGHNNLNRCLKEFHLEQPAQILDKLNDLVKETFENSDDEVKDGMDMALCSYDPTTHVLEYAGANNPLLVFRIGAAEGEVVLELKADKQPIGNYSFRKAFTNHRLQLQKGDCIYIFSDGYADQFGGEKGKKFKYKKLQSLLLSVRHEPMEKQEQILLDTFEVWRSQLEQVDDVLVIGLRV
jgi:serine phosphatase RsbU (regulator of sigma subunit)